MFKAATPSVDITKALRVLASKLGGCRTQIDAHLLGFEDDPAEPQDTEDLQTEALTEVDAAAEALWRKGNHQASAALDLLAQKWTSYALLATLRVGVSLTHISGQSALAVRLPAIEGATTPYLVDTPMSITDHHSILVLLLLLSKGDDLYEQSPALGR